MININLKQWVTEKNIIKKTIDGFWYCFNNYMNEEKEEFEEYFGNFDKSKLRLWFKEVRLTTRNCDEYDEGFWKKIEGEYNSNTKFIDALIVIGYGEDDDIGEYTMRFSIDGESFDDFFSMEWKEWFRTIEKQVKHERNMEIIKAALREGVGVELIGKITGLKNQDVIEIKEKLKFEYKN